MFKIQFKENEKEKTLFDNIETLNLNENIVICKYKEYNENNINIENYIKTFDEIDEIDEIENFDEE